MTTILVLNGPNLGRLGTREPEIYGRETLAELQRSLAAEAGDDVVVVRQTDNEGEMLAWLHAAIDEHTPVVLNAGAWTHYSYAVADAVALATGAGVPVIEVHISNVHARESFRHTSVLTPYATGVIAGFGLDSYRLALDHIRRTLA